ncbi:hypothetical protein M8J76_008084 [Diaphorina citri]|nr:hypothetical protein M8J75_007030 [Diaphorina citri]KAI5745077.1 hypothetical protein M8J76_008084 [Diaphorina citri]
MDVLCKVCGDKASGKHYGVPSCDGCRGFFKRSIRRNLEYVCKERGHCIVDVTRRNQCQACRFSKCLQVKMNRDAVQHERAPRSHGISTNTSSNSSYSVTSQLSSSTFMFPGSFILPPSSNTLTSNNLFAQSCQFVNFPLSPSPLLSQWNRLHSSLQNKVMIADDQVTSSEEIQAQINAGNRSPFCFEKSPSAIVTSPETNEATYESSAKLLFLAVKWAKSIPSFIQLGEKDQILLLEEAWCDLFVLNAAQCCFYVSQDCPGLTEVAHLECLQDQTLQMLLDYCSNKGKSRFGKLLLLLPYVSSLNKFCIQDIFFKKTVGNVPIENVITEMIRHGLLI